MQQAFAIYFQKRGEILGAAGTITMTRNTTAFRVGRTAIICELVAKTLPVLQSSVKEKDPSTLRNSLTQNLLLISLHWQINAIVDAQKCLLLKGT